MRGIAYFFIFLSSPLFPARVSDQDCFTGQSPGCLGSSGAGWKAAWIGGAEGCFGEHLAEGALVSLHVGVVEAILGEQAGREGVHGGMAGRSGPSGDEGCC